MQTEVAEVGSAVARNGVNLPDVGIHAGLERTIAYIRGKVLHSQGGERLLGERNAIPADAASQQ